MTCLIDLIYTDFKIDGSTQKTKTHKMAPRGEEENGAIKLEHKTSSANWRKKSPYFTRKRYMAQLPLQ